MDKLTSTASYTTSAAITWLGLNINEWLSVTGIILGIATFALNWVYKQKHLKLEERRRKGDQ